MSTTVSVPALASKPEAASAPRQKPRPNPRRKSPSMSPEDHRRHCQYAVRRDSQLNLLSHAALTLANQLIDAIDTLADSTAEDELYEALEEAGFCGMLIGSLEQAIPHVSGFRFVIQVFAEMLDSITLPLDSDADPLPGLLAHQPRGSR